jgi:hypothetical protein
MPRFVTRELNWPFHTKRKPQNNTQRECCNILLQNYESVEITHAKIIHIFCAAIYRISCYTVPSLAICWERVPKGAIFMLLSIYNVDMKKCANLGGPRRFAIVCVFCTNTNKPNQRCHLAVSSIQPCYGGPMQSERTSRSKSDSSWWSIVDLESQAVACEDVAMC